MNHQQDLFTDLPRGEQLQALRKIKLESYRHRGRSVSGAICKSVLRAIDDRAGSRGCFASQATIAEEVGCGVATVSRAIAALVAQDLITIEKANPWSANTHRINWTAVFSLVGQDRDGQRQEQTLPNAKSAIAISQDRDGTRPRPLAPEARQIAPSIANLNAPTNRDEWAEVVAELFRWGLKSAASAVDSARERGMSIEVVRELWLECGGHREPQRWEPGQLANWLTGKTDPPIDHDEAVRRIDERGQVTERRERSQADEIRRSVIQCGQAKQAEQWVSDGITFRKLSAAGLVRFATADEVAAGARMDEIDRQRGAKPEPERKRAPGVDSRSVGRALATPVPHERDNATVGRVACRIVPAVRQPNRSRMRKQVRLIDDLILTQQ